MGCLSVSGPGACVTARVHVKTRSCVSDYGLLGIGEGLLRMKSVCQAVSFSLAECVSPVVIVSLFLTGVLSVSVEVDGFVSVSLLSSTLHPVTAM